jgi:transposase
MGKKDAIRQKAEDWFIENSDCTQAEIAEQFSVSTQTVNKWYQKYNWEDQRRDYHSSPIKIKQLLQQELLAVAQGKEAKLNADAISKLNVAIDRLDKKLDAFVVKRVLVELDNFISQIDPKFAAQCTPFHKQYLQHRINLEIA